MSGAASTASRREIRRAFGSQAIEAIDSHADSITDLIVAVQAVATEHDTFKTAIEQRRSALDARLSTLWGRLRWLLVGR